MHARLPCPPDRVGVAAAFRCGSLGGALGLKPETARVRATVDQTASSNQLKMTILFSDPNAGLDKCLADKSVSACARCLNALVAWTCLQLLRVDVPANLGSSGNMYNMRNNRVCSVQGLADTCPNT